MVEYRFASAYNAAPLMASSHPNSQAGSSMRSATTIVSKQPERTGNLSSFLCHILYLQKKLMDDENLGSFLDDKVDHVIGRARVGDGYQFSVYSAQVKFKQPLRRLKANDSGQLVAVKVVKDDNTLHDWSSILLEVRALMHEQLRYHPNIVHLLGITWTSGWNTPSGSVFPMLVLEYARFGSLQSLQALSPPLSFAVKQKLCHDVARGLSILHACGIVHGDLKHENVLVFDNPYDKPPGQPYLAKLADFGGAAMDTKLAKSQSLKLGTTPYEAPEASAELSADGLKKTDVYSFGLLFWRALLDGKGLLEELGLASHTLEEAKILLQPLKNDDGKMLDRTYESIGHHMPPGAPMETMKLISFTLRRTLRTDPDDRNLAAAQAALRNGHVEGIVEHLADMANRNSNEVFERQDGIQRQDFNVDRVGLLLGKMVGDFYDAQQNIPGYRSELKHPAAGQFLFEPMKVKLLLSWKQQAKIVDELKAAARADDEVSMLGIPPFKAAFYVFQSYLAGFGVAFDVKEVCYWLGLAAEPDNYWQEVLLAQAWLWRVCEALQCPQPVKKDKSILYLRNSVACGFKESVTDLKMFVETLTDDSEKCEQMNLLKGYQRVLRTYAGGVGMLHYFPRTIRKKYNLSDLGILDQQIREELGEHYESALNKSNLEKKDETANRFDKVYVSNAGHGLLHYAATFGKVDILKHLLDTYKCDIDRVSTLRHETPLVCAVRSAQYDCAMFLLQRGAQPGIISLGEEGPLHCLCGFETEQEEEMRTIAKRLIDAGADIEDLSSSHGTKGIAADWDNLLNISTTPLGRAVIARNAGSIKVLLELGAEPRGKGRSHNKAAMSPVEIAAMLFYPGELQTLLESENESFSTDVFDEAWILETAHKRKRDSIDPSCLQSRLIRLGSQYKSAILDTFLLIRKWNKARCLPEDSEHPSSAASDLLYQEINLGDVDIVEALLVLDYDPNGTEMFRPLQAAVSTRNEQMFKLLLRFGADVNQRYLSSPGLKLTFLHAIASPVQGARMPDGVNIAKQLLAAGVPVEEPLNQCPVTPFTQCVMNNCFDVADILLAHGADLNPLYTRPPGEGPPISLLGGLVMFPNQLAVESIRYLTERASHEYSQKLPERSSEDAALRSESKTCLLLQMQNSQLSVAKLSPVGIPSLKMSVIHQVAHWMPDEVTYNWPASAEMMQLLLSAFDNAEVINGMCPEIGTPLIIAVIHLNVEFVRMLLGKKADPSIGHKFAKAESIATSLGVEQTPVYGTPLYMSLMMYEAILMKIEKSNHATISNIASIERLFSTAGDTVQLLLPLDRDEKALQVWAALQTKKDKLLMAITQIIQDKKGIAPQDDGKPVDLSILTEERPSGWSEGCEMTDEMVLRTLLQQFRQGFAWPDP